MQTSIETLKKDTMESAISQLPENQQEVVRICFQACNIPAKQRRYTMDWIYMSLLMRIKSKKLYEHIRELNILPLPCRDTLNRYIDKVDTSYGFQPAVFECLKVRASRMEIPEKHGKLDNLILYKNQGYKTLNELYFRIMRYEIIFTRFL